MQKRSLCHVFYSNAALHLQKSQVQMTVTESIGSRDMLGMTVNFI